jgi:citrate synthase
MLSPGGVKIWRPRQCYVGESERGYTAVRDRSDASGGDPTKAPTAVEHPSSVRSTYASHRDKPRDSHL